MLFGKKSRKGQALFELALVLTLLLVMMAGVMAIGPSSYARIATDAASYDCATAAGRSLNASRGAFQGRLAAQATLDGFGFNAGDMAIYVTTPNHWGRGEHVVCVVNYDLHLGRIPLATLITGELVRTISSSSTSSIERFKSNF